MTEAYRRLVDAFGRGWERGDPEEILSVFTADAVFVETPFSDRETGHAAIRRYWTDLPANQAEVTFKSGEIYAAGFGRFARMFVAQTSGYVHSTPAPTIEDVADHWAAINDEAGYYVPMDLTAWSASFMAHLDPKD